MGLNINIIYRAINIAYNVVTDVGINHSSFYIVVPCEFLDDIDICTGFA
jgi:hypothetical protein